MYLQLLMAVPWSSAGRHTMQAESLMTNYTAAAIIFILLVGFLVSSVLIGAFFVLNVGLLSKRPEDWVGGRAPSDLKIMTHVTWPKEALQRRFPAEDEAEEQPDEILFIEHNPDLQPVKPAEDQAA